LATLQPGVFYPPHLLYFLLPFNVVWNWLIILHFVLAGVAVYALLRYFNTSHTGSLVGGIVFMLSGYLLSVHNLLTHLFAVAWFPLTVLYCIKSFETGRKKHLVLTALFLSMEFFAGAPEIVMLTGPVLVGLALFPGGLVQNEGITTRGRAKVVIMVCMAALLLVCVQLLPFYELKQQSIRSMGLDYRQAITWSFAYRDVIQFFLPDAFGYAQTTQKYWANQSWLKTIYLGAIPFILSAFFFLEKGKRRWFFLALIGLSFLFALGGNTPAYRVLHHIPPFNGIRYPVKFLFLFFFVISLASGLGFDRLRAGVAEGCRKTGVVIQVCFYLGLCLAVLWGFLNLQNDLVVDFAERHGLKPDAFNEIWFNLHNLKRFLLFSFLFCGALIIYLRRKPKRLTELSMIAFLTADLFLANFGFYQTFSWKAFLDAEGFMKNLTQNRRTERYFVTPQTEDDYQHPALGRMIAISPYAGMFGLYAAGGSEVMKVRHYENFLNAHYCGRTLSEARRFFDVSGVRFITTSYEVNEPYYELVTKEDFGKKQAYLWEYTGYRERFLIYGKARFVDTDEDAARMLLDDGIDLRRELIISATGGTEVRDGGTVSGTVKLISYKANSVTLETDADNDAYLYLSDTWYPGWRAYVDGKETRIYRANLAFRAVGLTRGKHTVLFRYVPMSFYAGLFLTLLGITLCIWLWRRDRLTLSGDQGVRDHITPRDKGGGIR